MSEKGKMMIGAGFIACALFLLGCGGKMTVVKSMYDGDNMMWEHLFTVQPPVQFSSAPKGAILPHHMIVGLEISKFYQGLAKLVNPDVVVVISPNHYENGDSNVQVCRTCEYQTISGNLTLDNDLVFKIVDDGIAKVDDATFIKEHGIYNHAPFVKKFFPKAKLLPISLKWGTSPEETIQLSKWLADNLPSNSFVIASVDFSHYIPAEAANFHDVASYATIKNFDYNNIYDLEIDSPPSISTIIHLMDTWDYTDAERLNHTNNQDYHIEPIASTTSHQFIAFYQGAKKVQKTLTLMSVGNVAGQSPGFYDAYRWGGEVISDYLRDIRGDEDRFLVGADFLIFDLPESSGDCFSKAQNGLKISFCKFEEGGDLKVQIATIKAQKVKGADYVYVLYSFKTKKLSAALKARLKPLLDAGVDVFVGRGLDEKPIIETYGKAVVAYSLGDFIGDPDMAHSVGDVLDLALTPQGIEQFLFPVEVQEGYPKLQSF